jgi:hypothetical protein
VVSFHPGAQSSFSAVAGELLTEVRVYPVATPDPGNRFDIHPVAAFDRQNIIGEVTSTPMLVDSVGTETGRFWDSRGQRLGWTGESFQKMKRLAERIADSQALRGRVSEGFILDEVFSWLCQTLEGKRSDTISDFLSGRCDAEIVDHEIWIPLYRTYSSIAFSIGDVVFRAITRELLDKWFEGRVVDPELAEKVKALERQTRAQYQASLASCIKVRAEKRKASQFALDQSLNAIGLLRFLSPANWSCRMKSYVQPFGMQNTESWSALQLSNGAIQSIGAKAIVEGPDMWVVDDSAARFPNVLGLLSELCDSEQTEWRRVLYDAMLIYSRNSITADPATKLVFVMVSLESVLLKDSAEPIQGNLGERMAFLIGTSLKERRDIVATVKATYGMRSKFIHHGQDIDDIEVFERFLLCAWSSLLEMLRLQGKYATRLELLSKLDDMKLSGNDHQHK